MASGETLTMSRQQQRSDTDFSIATNLPSTPNEIPGQSPRQSNDLSYMHRPPTIMPNYGKKSRGSVLPKSSVSRVLLYDNITQQTMLDVRLNSIQSQSYKTNRELEMHMKSFISRRKARQKALKNLTRVQHHDDYLEFQQQQQQQQLRQQRIPFGSVESNSPEEQRASGHGNPFLPQIGYRSSSFHPRANHPSPGISCLRKHAKSVNSTREPYRSLIVNNANGNTSCEDDAEEIDKSSIDFDNISYCVNNHNKVQNEDCKNGESLPQITMSAPSHVVRSNKAVTGNSHLVNQNSKVGYRTVKGINGYTRIFHALQDMDSDKKQPVMESGVENSHRHHKLLPLRHNSQNRIMRMKERNRRDMKKLTREDFTLDQDELPLDRAENEDHPEEPLSDFRFLHLRKILIPQDPPNEGYTELSPSFPRRYPAIKDVVVMAKKRRKKDGKEGEYHEGSTLESDDDSMYSEGVEFLERPDDTGDVGNRM